MATNSFSASLMESPRASRFQGVGSVPVATEVTQDEERGSPTTASPASQYMSSLDSLFHTVSREDTIPMSHPTPDLQAMQGAYVGNIERLEQHAERLSLDSDLAEEVRRLKGELRRHGSNLSSPVKSIRAEQPTRSRALSGSDAVAQEPLLNYREGISSVMHRAPNSLSSANAFSLDVSGLQNLRSHNPVAILSGQSDADLLKTTASTEYDLLYDTTATNLQRHTSVASSTTMQQAKDAFSRFDGTHINETQQAGRLNSIDSRSHVDDSRNKHEAIPENHSQLVYYPAPIPMMLSLPPKLSKRRPISNINHARNGASDERQRRADVHDSSSQRLLGNEALENPDHIATSSSNPPFQSVKPLEKSNSSDNLLKLDDSAIKTLDRLLDASVRAPVSAFTDHPIVGTSGAEIYRTADRSKRRETANPRGPERIDSEIEPDEDERGIEHTETSPDTAMPTTLLAELESRKRRQQSRNRSAADAFPKGMHATLLQLDSVAQRQRDVRKTKHVTLLWEPTAAVEEDNDLRDEDTPLALLARPHGADTASDSQQPPGLLERKQLEENEPLSARRARLTGIFPSSGPRPSDRSTRTSYAVQSHGERNIKGEDNEGNEETLAQRKRRLQIQNAMPIDRGVSGELTSEMLGEFGIPLSQAATKESPPSEDDEPLAQRRQRLRGGPSAATKK